MPAELQMSKWVSWSWVVSDLAKRAPLDKEKRWLLDRVHLPTARPTVSDP